MKKRLKQPIVFFAILASILAVYCLTNSEEEPIEPAEEQIEGGDTVQKLDNAGEYENFISENAESMSSAYYDLTEHLELLEYSELWVIKATVIVERIIELTDEVILYDLGNVPSEYAEYHNLYLLGSIEHSNAMHLFVEGFNNSDIDLIEESFEAMSRGNRYIEEAGNLPKENDEI